MYAMMGQKISADDIVANVGSARATLYKDLAADTIFNHFKADISQAFSLHDIGTVPLPS
jgi:hypothetical protein